MIVILGNENHLDGTLKPIAKSRCDKAIDLWRQKDCKDKIVATGEYGSNFNMSTRRHYDNIYDYLVNAEPRIASSILASKSSSPLNPEYIGINAMNTYQDILGLREILQNEQTECVDIITSEFHYGRVRFYCDLILHDQKSILPNLKEFNIIPTTSPVTERRLEELKAHESQRMENILKFPTEAYTNATLEQKHYDNVSNWMITGLFTTFAIGYKYVRDYFGKLPKHNWVESLFLRKVFLNDIYFDQIQWRKTAYILFLIISITLFWQLYKRAAHTARTARRTLKNIERCYGQFGFSTYYLSGKLKNDFFTHKRMLETLYFIVCVTLFNEISVFASIAFIVFYLVFVFKKEDTHRL